MAGTSAGSARSHAEARPRATLSGNDVQLRIRATPPTAALGKLLAREGRFVSWLVPRHETSSPPRLLAQALTLLCFHQKCSRVSSSSRSSRSSLSPSSPRTLPYAPRPASHSPSFHSFLLFSLYFDRIPVVPRPLSPLTGFFFSARLQPARRLLCPFFSINCLLLFCIFATGLPSTWS